MNNFVVGKPSILNKPLFLKRVSDILDSHLWGNNGYYVQAVENHIKEYLQCQDAVLVSNATVGLSLALQALPKDIKTCLVPSFTFVATVAVLKQQGIKPVFGDIDDNYCLSYTDTNTDMVLPVNLFGNIISNEFYRSSKPRVVDNAHSLGVYNEELKTYVGSDCSLGVFSQHPTKFLGAGEAGIITCNDSNLGDYLRELRNFGYKNNSGEREGVIGGIGTNAKVSEIQAALCLTQLENIQEIQNHYYDIHQEYERLLPDLVKPKNTFFSNWSYVILEVENRENLIWELNKEGIFPRTYFTPVHTMKPYKENVSLPNTERISKIIMAMPTGLTIKIPDVRYICSRLRRIRNYGRR